MWAGFGPPYQYLLQLEQDVIGKEFYVRNECVYPKYEMVSRHATTCYLCL